MLGIATIVLLVIGVACANHSLEESQLPENRITRGNVVVIWAVPHMAMFVAKVWADYYFYCSANIIGRVWVLTAGHCLTTDTGGGAKKIGVRGMRVFVGLQSGMTPLTEKSGMRHVLRTFVPDRYLNPRGALKGEYDYGIAQVGKPFDYSDDVQPIKLASANYKTDMGSYAWIVGYGIKGHKASADFVFQLQTALMKRVEHTGFPESKPRLYMIGAKDPMANICPGDSGGSLVKDAEKGVKESVLIGLAVSSYCQYKEPGAIFMEIARIRGFIRSVTGF